MTSPARRHRALGLPDRPGLAPTALHIAAQPVSGRQSEQIQAAMDAAVSTLAGIRDIAEKIKYKRAQIPSFLPFVLDYMKSGAAYPNDVAIMVMVWLWDVGDVEQALGIGLYLQGQGMHRMPRRFDRGLEVFLCDALYDWANEELKASRPAAPYLGQLIHFAEVQKWDLHPAVRSKLYAMAAKHAAREGAYSEAVDWCMKAEQANPEGAGVKALKAQCLRALSQMIEREPETETV